MDKLNKLAEKLLEFVDVKMTHAITAHHAKMEILALKQAILTHKLDKLTRGEG